MELELFYYDCIIKEYEQQHKFLNIVNYLIKLYTHNNTSKILNTIIAYSWYFSISQEYDADTYTNWETYIGFWIKNIDIGLKKFPEDPGFNFIAGYSLGIHYEYVNKYRNNRKEYLIYMKKAAMQKDNLAIKLLAENFLENDKSRKIIFLHNNKIVNMLFPSSSLIDVYFKELYLSKE